MSGNAVKFGLVGFGAWGKMHAQSIAMNGDAKLAGIVAPSEASRAEARQMYPDAMVLGSHLEMLATCDLDIVDIVTPSHTHREICTAALAAGKHVLLEKPMALSLEDCRAMVRLAEEKQRM